MASRRRGRKRVLFFEDEGVVGIEFEQVAADFVGDETDGKGDDEPSQQHHQYAAAACQRGDGADQAEAG